MSLDFLTQVVANEKLIGDSRLCSKLVLDAIGLCSVIERPRLSQPCGLALCDLVAVDGKRVMKVTSHGLQKLPLKHDHTGGSAVKGRFVYVIGGCKTKEIEGVEIETLGFSTGVTFNCTKKLRYGAASCLMQNVIYISGGLFAKASAERCSLETKEFYWSLFNSRTMNFNRYGHAMVSLAEDNFFILGGNANERSFLLYDFYTNKESELIPMMTTRKGLAAVAFNEEIYAIAGASNGILLKSVEKYHPLIEKWDFVGSLNVARHRPGACVLDNQIVVVGGGSSVVEVYDAKNNKWNIVGECEELKDVFAIFPC